ncbi:MAG: hypothetical protein AAF649_10180 [Verrucomicrobiota bacterium]
MNRWKAGWTPATSVLTLLQVLQETIAEGSAVAICRRLLCRFAGAESADQRESAGRSDCESVCCQAESHRSRYGARSRKSTW